MTIGSDLRRTVTGQVLEPGDEGFEQARRPWNLAVEQPVRAVVEAADADDVAALVRYARHNGLTITAQPRGHGATGDVDNAILLRTGRLDDVAVSPDHRTARVGAGVKWGQVLEAAGSYGLTGLAGSSPVVTVTGYTLGGGLSWFSRKYGLAADSVRAFDIVDADGAQARITAGSDPDLFWALRGGGGDYALVTAVEFDLHPASPLFGGRMMWPAEQAPQVLDAYRTITATAPEELTVWYELLQFPGSPPLVAVDATFLGETGEAAALLRDLDKIDGKLADSRGALAVADLGSITAEPTDPGPGLQRAELLTDLNDEVATTLLAHPIAPLLNVQIRHLGGALTRPTDSAAGHLSEPYSLFMLGTPATPEAEAAVRERQHQTARALISHTSGRKPLTLLGPGERAATAFTRDALARLRAIKRARDPFGVFRSNFPILDPR